MCLNEARNSHDYYQSELYQLNRRYTHFLLDACREGVGNGEFRADTPITLVRDMIFGGIDHHTWAMLFGHGDIDVDQSADLIVKLVFAGIENRGLRCVLVRDNVLPRRTGGGAARGDCRAHGETVLSRSSGTGERVEADPRPAPRNGDGILLPVLRTGLRKPVRWPS